jgi:hypothetical protein
VAAVIPLAEYARRNGRAPATARQMAARGGFKTAQKIGRDWMIDEREPWPDKRVKYGEYIGAQEKRRTGKMNEINETFLTIEYATAYTTNLMVARHLTDEEKKQYRKELQDRIFIGVGGRVEIPEIGLFDLPDRESHAGGSFPGCENFAYIISREEWDAYVALNASRAAERKAKEDAEKLELLRTRMDAIQRQKSKTGRLPTAAEAAAKMKEYNDLFNEGGYGFVPPVYSEDDEKQTQAQIDKLTAPE